jgi:hypothetical protein
MMIILITATTILIAMRIMRTMTTHQPPLVFSHAHGGHGTSVPPHSPVTPTSPLGPSETTRPGDPSEDKHVVTLFSHLLLHCYHTVITLLLHVVACVYT